ncbi:MAG: glycosyltransferase WbuB [Rhodospirillaceae bacterium]|nr:glycosyltransferase WbuB [Rhodospirillaceae bacterium]
MHILYLHQYFCPPDGSGGTRSYEIAVRLVKAGHTVNLITSSAFFPKSYGIKKTTKLIIDGIKITILHIPYSNKMNKYQRIWAFIKFSLLATIYAIQQRSIDLTFATSTPLTIIIPGYIASKFFKAPLIFEVRDLWPDLPIAIGIIKNRFIKKITKRLETFAYTQSSTIIALSPGIKDEIIKQAVNPEKIVEIPNACDIALFTVKREDKKRFLSQNHYLGTGPLITYAGTIGAINGVEYIIYLAEAMLHLDPKIQFLICGDGAKLEYVKQMAITKNVLNKNTWIIPPLPKNRIPSLLSASSACLSLFQPLPEMRHNSANKFFDTLAAGKPIIINYSGWQAEIIEEYGIGLVLEGYNFPSIAEKIRLLVKDEELLDQTGQNALEIAKDKFDRNVLVNKLIKIIEHKAGNTPSNI